MKKYLILLLSAVLITALLLTGCGGSETTTTTATTSTQPTTTQTSQTTSTAATSTATPTTDVKDGGIFRMIIGEFPNGPLGVTWGASNGNSLTMGAVLEPLFTISNVDSSFVGLLATSMEWINNNTTLQFKLREGVKFHDGTDFNSAAVKWNFEKGIEHKIGEYAIIKSIDTPDDYTVNVNLHTYDSKLIALLAGNSTQPTFGYQMSPTAYEELGDAGLTEFAVGTGPFIPTSYRPDAEFTAKRFDGYWGGKPHLDGIKCVLIADPVTAQMAFEAGEAEQLNLGTSQTYIAMRDLSSKGYNFYTFLDLKQALVPSGGRADSPYAKKEVREAVEYAIDKVSICNAIFNGFYTPVYTFSPPALRPALDFDNRTYDPERAKQLLSEAGYPDGFSTTLYCGEHFNNDAIPLIQSYLNAVGINTEIDIVTIAKWIDMETNGWDGLLISPTGNDSILSQYFARFWWTPDAPNWNHGIYWDALYRPEGSQELLEQFMAEPDPAKQVKIGKEIVHLQAEWCSSIPLWDWQGCVVTQPYVHDMRYPASKGVSLWYDWANGWMDQ